jgi:hypothetical protein
MLKLLLVFLVMYFLLYCYSWLYYLYRRCLHCLSYLLIGYLVCSIWPSEFTKSDFLLVGCILLQLGLRLHSHTLYCIIYSYDFVELDGMSLEFDYLSYLLCD